MVLVTAQLGVAWPDWGLRKVRNITPGIHLHLGKLGWRHVLPVWWIFIKFVISSVVILQLSSAPISPKRPRAPRPNHCTALFSQCRCPVKLNSLALEFTKSISNKRNYAMLTLTWSWTADAVRKYFPIMSCWLLVEFARLLTQLYT